jgi:outer membrane beta-barrel protein
MHSQKLKTFCLLPLLLASFSNAWAAPATEEKVETDKIKEKYWAGGNDAQLGVVQNRLYSKAKKAQISLLGGGSFSDPFLSVQQVGLSAGYHFNEYISLHALAWYYFANPSAAQVEFERNMGARANTNPQKLYLGAEIMGSLLYGKLSVVGKKIIYFDLHLLGGAGATNTFSGVYFTPSFGLGQQIFVHKMISIGVDYRFQFYNEAIIEQVSGNALYGQVRGYRFNFTHNINLGVNFLLGKDKK